MRNRKDAGFRRARTLHLPVEALERRALMSGNVTAAQAGTILTLAGDALANEIMVRSGNAPDVIVVDGLAQTLVNGSNQPLEFTGVRRLEVTMGGGDDWFKGTDFNLNATFFGQLNIDGGTGDDRLELKNTTVTAGPAGGLARPNINVYGDRSIGATEPNTGDDTIQIVNTTILAEGTATTNAVGVAMNVYGDFNSGSEITGGNDSISVTDTRVVGSGGRTGIVGLTIYGDYNAAGAGATSTIGGGNDSISVTNTAISAGGGANLNRVVLTIIGDENLASGSASAGSTASIGGGNDSISVANVDVSAVGNSLMTNSTTLTVQGTIATSTLAPGASADPQAVTSAVGGGNDTISITNVNVSAVGNASDSLRIEVEGDTAFASAAASSPGEAVSTIGGGNDSMTLDNIKATAANGAILDRVDLEIIGDLTAGNPASGDNARSEVGGGNDDIEVKNSTFVAADETANLVGAVIEILGDSGNSDFPDVPGNVGEGDDTVALRHVQVSGRLSTVDVHTSVGDDALDVQNSSLARFIATLGDGDDAALFNANDFATASLDGGAGYDVLSAHNNVGVLTFSNFEVENVTP